MSPTLSDSVIIVGAGVFGLSTALAIAKRDPAVKVTVVDRLIPPVEDGASVDTTRCIRSDYADPVYARLAREAQQKIERDPELQPHYFKQGMTFVTDESSSQIFDFWKRSLENIRTTTNHEVIELPSPEAVYQRLHGKDARLVADDKLGAPRRWNRGYCNMDDAFIDAKECVRVYYERCLAQQSIEFRCGVAVDRICVENQRATGVILRDGTKLSASLVLVAAGAWSNSLVDLEGITESTGIAVAWLKLTDDEVARWKNMSITTNFDTGLNMFPPHNGEMKLLIRTIGFKNTVSIPHPEGGGRELTTSLPRTRVTNPKDVIPWQVETAMRDDLRELMPALANRRFDRSQVCWVSKTKSTDFVIAPHPAIQGLHVATGDSAHGWKFLTIIGDLIVDSIEGKLEKDLAQRWAWAGKGIDNGSTAGMGGPLTELQPVVRNRSRL